MREILFRGKRKSNGEWVYGNYCGAEYLTNEGIEHLIIEVPRSGSSAQVILETVGQYTGLTDKNGKKIFEGDIMPVYEQGEEYYYKVVYNGDCFMLAMLDSEQGSYPLSAKNAISEVIGNIHDNPELLKGGVE